PRPDDPDVRRDLPPDLVAQTQPGLARAEACGDAALRIVPAVEIELQVRLEDQAIGQQQLVLRLDPERRAAGLADVRRCLDVEPVRCEPLDANGCPRA